ncbi:MAG: hypothetical protein RL095_4042 [Verrucomicrobiota bacterium]|jgi:citrate synthase
MSEKAKLILPEKTIELPLFTGTEGEKAIDIMKLRQETGYVTFDPGFGNTCPAQSKVTFLDGDNGILRYRGYAIDELCDKSSFEAVSWLVLHGELPSASQSAEFSAKVAKYSRLPDGILKLYDTMPKETHPMVLLSIGLSALSAYYPGLCDPKSKEQVEEATACAIGSMLPLVSFAYCRNQGRPYVYPVDPKSSNAAALLKMMFGNLFVVDKDVEDVMDDLLILHADHEFNCSTSAVRLVGSSQANLFASLAAGVNALWGPLHGGANQAVVEMLLAIAQENVDPEVYVARVKQKDSGSRLMGFGHRVYKNYDPRATIIKKTCDKVMSKLGADDPLLKIAQSLEKAALADPYFTSRKLYPNVDFYSGIVYRALNIPVEMFTPLFALGRLPGWIAHWREQNSDALNRIGRPRQIYQGAVKRAMT